MLTRTGPLLSNPISINFSQYTLSRSSSVRPAMQTKAVIPEEAKAYSTLVKDVRASLTPKGIKVDIIR